MAGAWCRYHTAFPGNHLWCIDVWRWKKQSRRKQRKNPKSQKSEAIDGCPRSRCQQKIEHASSSAPFPDARASTHLSTAQKNLSHTQKDLSKSEKTALRTETSKETGQAQTKRKDTMQKQHAYLSAYQTFIQTFYYAATRSEKSSTWWILCLSSCRNGDHRTKRISHLYVQAPRRQTQAQSALESRKRF